MKTYNKLIFVLIVTLIVGFIVSCVSTGEYMPLADKETVIGTAQTTFAVKSSFFVMKSVKNSINKQAYIMLLETAGQKYSGNIDVRDIVWVTGRTVENDPTSTEIFATGKVIRGNSAAEE
jgi:ABC-type uncharacterized transport system permease subunit